MAKRQYNVGDVLECTMSASPGYKRGQQYTVVKHKNMTGLWGSDGYFDPMVMLVSEFRHISRASDNQNKEEESTNV